MWRWSLWPCSILHPDVRRRAGALQRSVLFFFQLEQVLAGWTAINFIEPGQPICDGAPDALERARRKEATMSVRKLSIQSVGILFAVASWTWAGQALAQTDPGPRGG